MMCSETRVMQYIIEKDIKRGFQKVFICIFTNNRELLMIYLNFSFHKLYRPKYFKTVELVLTNEYI